MEWLPHHSLLIAGAASVAVAILIQRTWKWIILPGWRLIKAMVDLADKLHTLDTIAEEFQPNHGTSLRDVVDRLELGQNENKQLIVDGLEEISNKIDTFILQTQPGGLRSTDRKKEA